MGHSFGGVVAAGVAARVKGARQLVLVDSAGIKEERSRLQWILTYIRELPYEAWTVPPALMLSFGGSVVKFILANLSPKTYSISSEIMDLDAADVFKKVRQPTLIVWGSKDAHFQAASMNRIKLLIAKSRMVRVEGSHNWCLLKPKIVVDVLRNI